MRFKLVPSPVIRVEFLLGGISLWRGVRDTTRKGNLCLTFRQKVEESFPMSAVFQLPSVQNNSHAEMAYIGVAYFFLYLLINI